MLKLLQPFRKQGQQLCSDGNTTVFFDAYNVNQMHDAYQQGLAAQPVPAEEHSLSLSYQIRRAIKAEDALHVAKQEIANLNELLNAAYVDKTAQQAQPVCGYDDETGNCTQVNCCKQAQPEQCEHGTAWDTPCRACDDEQAQPERAPLSDEQIMVIGNNHSNSDAAMTWDVWPVFARAIEAASLHQARRPA